MKLEISGYGYEKLLNDMNENSISCFNVKSEKWIPQGNSFG